MPIQWTKEAADDLESLLAYIEQDSSLAAVHVARRISQTIRNITLFPDAARLDRETGAREAVVRGMPLLIIYNVTNTFIEIIAVFHTARNPKNRRQK